MNSDQAQQALRGLRARLCACEKGRADFVTENEQLIRSLEHAKNRLSLLRDLLRAGDTAITVGSILAPLGKVSGALQAEYSVQRSLRVPNEYFASFMKSTILREFNPVRITLGEAQLVGRGALAVELAHIFEQALHLLWDEPPNLYQKYAVAALGMLGLQPSGWVDMGLLILGGQSAMDTLRDCDLATEAAYRMRDDGLNFHGKRISQISQILGRPVFHTVVRGDSLSGIAQSRLGDARRWIQIYDINRNVIGPNPGMIFPGQELVVPCR